MLLNIRWGSLRAKIIAWFFVPSAVILLAVALVAFLALKNTPYQGLVIFLLVSSLIVPAAVVSLGVRRIAKPISDLTGAAQEVAKGNFGLTVSAETGDEIEELAEQFNLMSTQLQKAYTNLEQMVANRTQELETLNAITNVVSASLNLDEVLRAALNETLTRLNLNAGAILLLDEEHKVLSLRMQQGFTDNLETEIQYLGQDQGISGQALAQETPIVMQTGEYIKRVPENIAALLLSRGVKTMISTPILHKGNAIGTMTLASTKTRNLSQPELDLLIAIGSPIGLAVENARLYNQARQEIELRRRVEEELRFANEESIRQNRELTLLNRVISATTSDMDTSAILEIVCRELVKAFDVAQSAAAVMDDVGETLTVVAECKSDNWPSAMGVVIPVEENPATLYVMKHKKPLALLDAQNDILLTPVHDIMRQRGTVSILIIPIIAGDEVIGTIGMDATEKRVFSEEDIELASHVAAAAARALQRARNTHTNN